MSKLIGDWAKLENILGSFKDNLKLDRAAKLVGNTGASAIKRGIRSGAPGGQKFLPLSTFTKSRKKTSKPLIESGTMIGNVTYKVFDDSKVFIGVKRGGDPDRANIAAVHEFGCTIEVTPKMRAYLHYQGLHLKPSTQFINIPARPFLRPVLNSDEFCEKVAQIYLEALRNAFGGG